MNIIRKEDIITTATIILFRSFILSLSWESGSDISIILTVILFTILMISIMMITFFSLCYTDWAATRTNDMTIVIMLIILDCIHQIRMYDMAHSQIQTDGECIVMKNIVPILLASSMLLLTIITIIIIIITRR